MKVVNRWPASYRARSIFASRVFDRLQDQQAIDGLGAASIERDGERVAKVAGRVSVEVQRRGPDRHLPGAAGANLDAGDLTENAHSSLPLVHTHRDLLEVSKVPVLKLTVKFI
jgi:hypothetical protein